MKHKMKDNEANYFAFSFYNGILLGFGIFKYPEHNRTDLVFYLPFLKFAWIKQMMDDEEAEEFMNQE